MRQLSEAEKLSIAVDVLNDYGLTKFYAAECEAKESEPTAEELLRELTLQLKELHIHIPAFNDAKDFLGV